MCHVTEEIITTYVGFNFEPRFGLRTLHLLLSIYKDLSFNLVSLKNEVLVKQRKVLSIRRSLNHVSQPGRFWWSAAKIVRTLIMRAQVISLL